MLAITLISIALICGVISHVIINDKVNNLQDLVDSHWKATQNECSTIWEKIDGEQE